MEKAIIGKKIGMTQIFDEAGHVVPVTVIEAGPCTVVQKKTAEKDGYEAIQLGYQTVPERKLTKPEVGHQKKAGLEELKKVLKEFRLDDCSKYEIGDELKADVFAAGDRVDVSGVSKGHGYSGVVQRWNQHTGPMKHGSKYHRGVGSMSANSDPSRVFKNKHMPGQYGHENVTVLNLEVVRVDAERNLLLIRGALPGANGATLVIRDSVKA